MKWKVYCNLLISFPFPQSRSLQNSPFSNRFTFNCIEEVRRHFHFSISPSIFELCSPNITFIQASLFMRRLSGRLHPALPRFGDLAVLQTIAKDANTQIFCTCGLDENPEALIDGFDFSILGYRFKEDAEIFIKQNQIKNSLRSVWAFFVHWILVLLLFHPTGLLRDPWVGGFKSKTPCFAALSVVFLFHPKAQASLAFS